MRWHIRKDGTRFWCASTITPLFDENKQVRSFARVMHDLTDTEATKPFLAAILERYPMNQLRIVQIDRDPNRPKLPQFLDDAIL